MLGRRASLGNTSVEIPVVGGPTPPTSVLVLARCCQVSGLNKLLWWCTGRSLVPCWLALIASSAASRSLNPRQRRRHDEASLARRRRRPFRGRCCCPWWRGWWQRQRQWWREFQAELQVRVPRRGGVRRGRAPQRRGKLVWLLMWRSWNCRCFGCGLSPDSVRGSAHVGVPRAHVARSSSRPSYA